MESTLTKRVKWGQLPKREMKDVTHWFTKKIKREEAIARAKGFADETVLGDRLIGWPKRHEVE